MINIMSKRWTDYKTWDELGNNQPLFNQYVIERDIAHTNFNFNWNKVLEQGLTKISDNELHTGIIKCESDGKTLYIDHLGNSDNVGYFICYIRSINIKPTFDTHIYNSLIHSYEMRFFGDIIISEYGIMVFYFPLKIRELIIKRGAELAFFTFCNDVLSIWNSFQSMYIFKLSDRLDILKKFGIQIYHIPSEKFKEDNKKKYRGYMVHEEDSEIETYVLEMIKKLTPC